MTYKNAAGDNAKSVVRLEQELWQSLCGREVFTTAQGTSTVAFSSGAS